MVPSLNRTRFWSAEPPLTLKPLDASPTLFTPGSVRTTLRTSASPKAEGILEMVLILTRSIPILESRWLTILSADTITSLRDVTFSFITTSRPPSLFTWTLR